MTESIAIHHATQQQPLSPNTRPAECVTAYKSGKTSPKFCRLCKYVIRHRPQKETSCNEMNDLKFTWYFQIFGIGLSLAYVDQLTVR